MKGAKEVTNKEWERGRREEKGKERPALGNATRPKLKP